MGLASVSTRALLEVFRTSSILKVKSRRQRKRRRGCREGPGSQSANFSTISRLNLLLVEKGIRSRQGRTIACACQPAKIAAEVLGPTQEFAATIATIERHARTQQEIVAAREESILKFPRQWFRDHISTTLAWHSQPIALKKRRKQDPDSPLVGCFGHEPKENAFAHPLKPRENILAAEPRLAFP